MGRWMCALSLSWVLQVTAALAQPPGAGPVPQIEAEPAQGEAVPPGAGWTGPAQNANAGTMAPQEVAMPRPEGSGDNGDDAGTPPFAYQNRIAISLGFGFGSIALGDFEALAANQAGAIGAAGPPTSGLQINVEMSARYYLPYYVLLHVGFSALYNWAESDIGSTHKLTNDNLVMEVPILVGGYYPVWKRLFVYGALGPSIAFGSRSWWDIVPLGRAPNFRADGTVGFQILAGADFFIGPRFAVSLELRYRALESEPFRENDSGIVMPRPGGGSYTMDYSGLSLGLNLRLFAL